MVRRVFQPQHPRLTPPGSPFLSGLYALDRWFSTLSRGLTSANNICSGIPSDRSSIRPFFNMSRKTLQASFSEEGLLTRFLNPGYILWVSTGSSTACLRISQSNFKEHYLFLILYAGILFIKPVIASGGNAFFPTGT